MPLNLVGLDPVAERHYTWIGDTAVDVAASDVITWLRTGEGLEIKQGQEPTVFRCKALTPTILQIVLSIGRIGLTPGIDVSGETQANNPAVVRAAVAYGLVSVGGDEELQKVFRKVSGAGASRVADSTLDILDRLAAEIEVGGQTAPVRLLEHLGNIILNESIPSFLAGTPSLQKSMKKKLEPSTNVTCSATDLNPSPSQNPSTSG